MTVPSWFLSTSSTVVVVILLAGLFFRKRNRQLHWKLMATAFVLDVALVLVIELSRGAVEKAVSTTSPLVAFHVAISVAVLVGYVAMIFLGRRLLGGDESVRTWHRNVGIAFIVFRALNYITSFMVA